MQLRRFQTDFLRNAMRPEIDMACLSLPRGNGKSWLAAHLAGRVLDPDDDLFRPGTESVVIAPSLAQGRIVYRFVRDTLGDDSDYRFADSPTQVQIIHKPTRTGPTGAFEQRQGRARACEYPMGNPRRTWRLQRERG